MTPHTILWMPSTHTFNSMLCLAMVVVAVVVMMVSLVWLLLTTWWLARRRARPPRLAVLVLSLH